MSLSFCLSPSLCVCVCVSLFMSLSVCLSVCLCLCLSLSLSLVPTSQPHSLYPHLHLPAFLSLSLPNLLCFDPTSGAILVIHCSTFSLASRTFADVAEHEALEHRGRFELWRDGGQLCQRMAVWLLPVPSLPFRPQLLEVIHLLLLLMHAAVE